MQGTITSLQKCPICGGKFVHDERRHGLFCPNHPDQSPTRKFRVAFGRKVDKQFSSYEKAARFLNGLRFESDKGTFDYRDYREVHPHGFRILSLKFVHEKQRQKLAESTKRKIALHIGKAAAYFGDKPVKAFKKRDFKAWLRELPVKSDKTRHDYLATVKQFFTDWLLDEEYLTRDQLPEFPKISFDLEWRGFTDFETQNEVMAALYELTFETNPKIYLGADLLRTYPTLRPGDLLRINEGDFEMRNGVLLLNRPTKSRNRRRKVIRLLPEHVEAVSEMKTRFPALPNVPFFRWHGGENNSTRAGQPFGAKCIYLAWKRACKKVGLDGVDLYGGTRHTTTTALAIMAGPEAAKEATEHQTNKAFERYCQLSGQRAHEMAKVIREAQTGPKGKVLNINGKN